MSELQSTELVNKLKKLIVDFFLDKRIPLTYEFYLIDFQKITNIFYFLKSVYSMFFRKVDKLFYEFVIYVFNKLYNYNFIKFVKNTKKNYLMFDYQQFEFYVLFSEKPDNKLSIRYEFTLKNGSVHQCAGRQYTIVKLITTGSYGKVYLCQDEHKKKFAMKLFQSEEELNIELEALTKLKNVDGIIKQIDNLYFNLLNVPFGAFTMPYMEYTLKSFIETMNPSEDIIIKLFYELLIILRNSHANGVIHMDFKPENVLISINPDGSFDICLADLGLAEILPEGTYYAKTIHEKITSWFRCLFNSLSKANNEMFHISWIADFYAWCVSILYMMSLRISQFAPPSRRKFDFLKSDIFDIFRTQAYLSPNDSSDKNPKEINIKFSTDKINEACQTIKNSFLRNLLIEYMNPETVLRWYSELETSPKNNSIIPEVIAKMKTYFQSIQLIKARPTESDTETPPRPHTTECP